MGVKQRQYIFPVGPGPVLALPPPISAESRMDSQRDACVSYDPKSHLSFTVLGHG